MRFVDEFRDRAKATALLRRIGRLDDEIGRPLQIMEVCGGHTHTIFRYGLEQLLPPRIGLVHGPGCPVCVLPMGRVDDCVALAERSEVILATFGDAVRVPGSRKSLQQAKAEGADVRIVYSPLDALVLARTHPDREVVFFGLGFDTTMPGTALTILEAERLGVGNFSVFCNHITIVPTLKALLDSDDLCLDGFIGPGHVSMVTGTGAYGFVAQVYRKPFVVSGFEPVDILQALAMVLAQIRDGRVAVENQYSRVVGDAGNRAALRAIERVYEARPSFEWRGLGPIDGSGVRLREAYAAFDAERRFPVPGVGVVDPAACRCGEVLRGLIRPRQCGLFGTACTPRTPMGALMVSSEGACAAYHQYGGGAHEDPSA